MTWFKVDDGFHDHPKVLALQDGKHYGDALGLWMLAGTWCARHLVEGKVPRAQVTRLGFKLSAASELVRVGLWHETDSGFEFNQWEDYQPTKDVVEEKRKATRERVKRWRNGNRDQVRKDDVTHGRNAPRNALHGKNGNSVSNASPVPSRPVPSRSDPPLPPDRWPGVAWCLGDLPSDLCVALAAASGDSAADFSAAVQARLQRDGWAVQCEVQVPDRGDGRVGRIDLVATRGPDVVAIELDRKTPRQKSIFKLESFPCTGAVIAVRELSPEPVEPSRSGRGAAGGAHGQEVREGWAEAYDQARAGTPPVLAGQNFAAAVEFARQVAQTHGKPLREAAREIARASLAVAADRRKWALSELDPYASPGGQTSREHSGRQLSPLALQALREAEEHAG